MRKLLKRLAVGLGCLLLLPILLFGFLFITREPPDGPRIAAGPGVVGVEAGGAYAWIVRTAHGAVLVDAGMDASGAAILAELRAQGLAAADVRAVLRRLDEEVLATVRSALDLPALPVAVRLEVERPHPAPRVA